VAEKIPIDDEPLLPEPTFDSSESLVFANGKPHLTKERLDQIPWLKDRYLLPGEEAEDYDLRLQALLDSIETHNALDAIMAKDIHDEMFEMHRLRTLKNTFLVDGMRKYVDKLLGGYYENFDTDEVDPEISKFVTGWLDGDKSVVPGFVSFIESKGIALPDLQMHAFRINADDILQVDIQMARHQKNISESLKLIEMRRNNSLARQRIEQEMERLSANTLVVEHVES